MLSGFPYTKLLYNPFYGYYGVYEAPLGDDDPVTGETRRYPTQHIFNVRVEKTFRIGRSNFGISVDVYNLFNADTPMSYYTFDNPQFGTVSDRTSPINARINLRFFF